MGTVKLGVKVLVLLLPALTGFLWPGYLDVMYCLNLPAVGLEHLLTKAEYDLTNAFCGRAASHGEEKKGSTSNRTCLGPA